MIIGIGTDITSLERIGKLLEKHGERFLKRIYTPAEQEYCKKFSNPNPHFAARFASKEATYKALGGLGPIHWTEMEIRNEPTGQPILHLHGETKALANRLGVRKTHVTLAHDAGVAVAFVVLEKDDPVHSEEPDLLISSGDEMDPLTS